MRLRAETTREKIRMPEDSVREATPKETEEDARHRSNSALWDVWCPQRQVARKKP